MANGDTKNPFKPRPGKSVCKCGHESVHHAQQVEKRVMRFDLPASVCLVCDCKGFKSTTAIPRAVPNTQEG
jgi:hypothetical protein